MNHLLKKTKLFLLAVLLGAVGFILFAQPVKAGEALLDTTIYCKGSDRICITEPVTAWGHDPIIIITGPTLPAPKLQYTQK